MTPRRLYLRTIELLESIGFAFTLTADGMHVECLSTPDAMVEALGQRVDEEVSRGPAARGPQPEDQTERDTAC